MSEKCEACGSSNTEYQTWKDDENWYEFIRCLECGHDSDSVLIGKIVHKTRFEVSKPFKMLHEKLQIQEGLIFIEINKIHALMSRPERLNADVLEYMEHLEAMRR